MAEKNTVSVLICGQEYTLSGEMPREYIMKLADKVDETMRSLGAVSTQSLSKTAILAAMSIADEYYRSCEDAQNLAKSYSDLRQQSADYERLWEEVKQSFSNFKTEQQSLVESLRMKISQQEDIIANAQEVSPEVQARIAELENRCRDIESSFFDLQMENIRLKNELENYKR